MVATSGVTMQYLKPFHTYDFFVLAGGWRSNDQTPSRIVSAQAYVTKPTHAPTLVNAVPQPGAVTLSWTDNNPNVWFKILYRDSNGVIAETPDPTPNKTFNWILPLGGYTFYVVENNQAGDGPLSNGIQATPEPCGSTPFPACPHAAHTATPNHPPTPTTPVLTAPDGRPVIHRTRPSGP
jgi:hypothetical protein